tara:strand:- start:1110 stop:1430 length:321 start_codon:yes stop_codon:yes gene_type:complete
MSLDIDLIEYGESMWSGNMTHNLNKIAIEAGVYECIWRPDEIGVKYARDNISNLRFALGIFYSKYDELKKLNPSNGWGDIDGLIEVTQDFLKACMEYPEAIIYCDR